MDVARDNSGGGLMAGVHEAFEIASQNGCLVVRDTESVGDVSEWDPAEQSWFVDRGSAIFAVLPGVEGMLRCEVWRDMPDEALPVELFRTDFDVAGSIQVEDPAGAALVELPSSGGARTVRVLVDDREWARQVQVVVT